MINTTPFYERKSYFLSPEDFKIIVQNANSNLKTIAESLCPALYENWKAKITSEKGQNFTLFCACKDEELSQKIVDDFKTNKFGGQYANAKAKDGKAIYRVEIENGKEIGQLDLIRASFKDLPKALQNAYFETALFNVSLIKTYLETHDKFDFKHFEALSSDIHEFWVSKNLFGEQKSSLLLPYLLMPVQKFQDNEKDKARNQLFLTINELTKQSNVLKDQQSNFLCAIENVFQNKATKTGLDEKYLKQLENLKPEIAERNAYDFGMRQILKNRVQKSFNSAIIDFSLTPETFTFEDFENKICLDYYEIWKSFHNLNNFNKNYNVQYFNLKVNNEKFNPKQFVREQVSTFINEFAKEGIIDAKYAEKVNGFFEKEIPQKNKVNFKKFSQPNSYQPTIN